MASPEDQVGAARKADGYATMVGDQQRQKIDDGKAGEAPRKRTGNERQSQRIHASLHLLNKYTATGTVRMNRERAAGEKRSTSHDGRNSMFPPELLCVPKQIHCSFAPDFFAVLLGRIPGELNAHGASPGPRRWSTV